MLTHTCALQLPPGAVGSGSASACASATPALPTLRPVHTAMHQQQQQQQQAWQTSQQAWSDGDSPITPQSSSPVCEGKVRSPQPSLPCAIPAMAVPAPRAVRATLAPPNATTLLECQRGQDLFEASSSQFTAVRHLYAPQVARDSSLAARPPHRLQQAAPTPHTGSSTTK